MSYLAELLNRNSLIMADIHRSVSLSTEHATYVGNNLLDKPNQLHDISFLFQNGKFLKVPEWI